MCGSFLGLNLDDTDLLSNLWSNLWGKRMVGLREVEQRITELKASIAHVLKEIEALEMTSRVLRSIERGESFIKPANRDFSDLTMPEAAEQVLTECAPQSLHYRRIAELAFERGFKGKRTDPNSPIEKVAHSFRRMMGQKPEVFEALGEGMYRINAAHLQHS